VAWVTLPVLVFAAVLLLGRILWKEKPAHPIRSSDVAVRTSKTSEGSATAELPASTAAARRVSLRVGASPVKAKLYLDGEPLGSNPYSGSAPSDSAEHSIRAEAPGYASENKVVTFDKDLDVELGLLPNKPIRSKIAPRASSPPLEPAANPEAPQIDCNPPHYIDENGIRRLKAECL
jgi:serine/threonine-protein kinase